MAFKDLAKTFPGIFSLQWESLYLKADKSFLKAFGPIEDLAKLFQESSVFSGKAFM